MVLLFSEGWGGGIFQHRLFYLVDMLLFGSLFFYVTVLFSWGAGLKSSWKISFLGSSIFFSLYRRFLSFVLFLIDRIRIKVHENVSNAGF